jgi:hypothetical protein
MHALLNDRYDLLEQATADCDLQVAGRTSLWAADGSGISVCIYLS